MGSHELNAANFFKWNIIIERQPYYKYPRRCGNLGININTTLARDPDGMLIKVPLSISAYYLAYETVNTLESAFFVEYLSGRVNYNQAKLFDCFSRRVAKEIDAMIRIAYEPYQGGWRRIMLDRVENNEQVSFMSFVEQRHSQPAQGASPQGGR